MRFAIIDCEQRSPEWYAARAGLVTGSRAADMFAMLKSGKGEAAARRDYRMQLAIERITGKAIEEDGWLSKDVQRGRDLEPEAFGMYEALTGQVVRKTGFIHMKGIFAGCSLDGDVSDFEGIIELKCPKSTTHIAYIRDKQLPPDYEAQVKHNLWVTGAKWCDFISYDNRMPAGLEFFCVRVNWTDFDLLAYERDLNRFLAEVAVESAQLQELRAA